MKDPFKFYGLGRRFPSAKAAMRKSAQQPYIGVTQGGSSRPGHPAKIAATRGRKRAELPQKENKDAGRPEDTGTGVS